MEARKKQLADSKAAGVKVAEKMAAATELMAAAKRLMAAADEKMTAAKDMMTVAKDIQSEWASKRCISCDKTGEETGTCYVLCDGCVQWNDKPSD